MEAMLLACILLGKLERFASISPSFLETEPAADATAAYQEAASILVIAYVVVGARVQAKEVIARMERVSAIALAGDAASRGWLKYCSTFCTYLLDPDPWAARTDALDAKAGFEGAGDRRMMASSRAPLGFIEWELSGLAAAETILREGLTLLEPLEEVLILAYLAMNLALLLAQYGPSDRLGEARALAEMVVEKVPPSTVYAGTAQCALAHVCRRTDRCDEGEVHARTARSVLKTMPGMSAPAYVAEIENLLAQGRAAEALAVAGEGEELIRTLGGAGSYEIPLRLAVAEARHAAGDAEGARAAIAEAKAAIDERAARIADAGHRAHFLERLPPNVRVRELARLW
jgi:eukaryotic-like serine/threonine-protein kinase